MNLPNKLTILRVLLIPVFLFVYLSNIFGTPNSQYIALAIFIIASLTDALDGHIARSQNLVTNFGKFMDPLADKLLVAAALIAMVGVNVLPSWVVFIIIAREFIVTGFRLIAASNNIVIAAGNLGKLKTVTQMLLIIYVMLGFTGGIFDIITTILIWLSVIFSIASGVEYIYKNKEVLNEQG